MLKFEEEKEIKYYNNIDETQKFLSKETKYHNKIDEAQKCLAKDGIKLGILSAITGGLAFAEYACAKGVISTIQEIGDVSLSNLFEQITTGDVLRVSVCGVVFVIAITPTLASALNSFLLTQEVVSDVRYLSNSKKQLSDFYEEYGGKRR